MEDLYRDIYSDRDSLKSALRNFWEWDRLASFASLDGADFADVHTDLKNAIRSLPQIHKQCIWFYFIVGEAEYWVAQHLGRPQSSVNALVNDSLDRIGGYLRNGA